MTTNGQRPQSYVNVVSKRDYVPAWRRPPLTQEASRVISTSYSVDYYLKIGIKFDYGWFLGLIGALGILTGGLLRQAIGNRARKPPGVI